MSIDLIIKDINKKYKRDIVVKGHDIPTREQIPFTSPLMNYLTRGGIAENKMSELFGAEGSAKTTLALDLLKNFQLKYPDSYAVYLDAENTLDTEWGERLGVDFDKVIVIKPSDESGEMLLDMVLDCIRSGGVRFVIIDSVPFILPQMALEKQLDEKTYAGNSALMTTFCQKVIPLLNQFKCTMICINQVRDKMGVTYTAYDTVGGHMLKHSYVQRFYLRKGKLLDADGREQSNSFETPHGNLVNVKYEKNKITKNDRKATYFTLKYETGIDVMTDTIELAIHLGVIRKAGAWLYYTVNDEELKWNGKSALISDLTGNDELFQLILTDTNTLAKE